MQTPHENSDIQVGSASGAQSTPAPSPAPPKQRQPIKIVAYNPRWQAIYEAEKQRLLGAFQKAGFSAHVLAVEHIGSTSVSGLGAKPIVDLMIGVRSLADLGTFPAEAMASLGYVSRPFSGVPNPPRLLFSKYATPATNVHVFVKDESRWRGHLAVRDYLRAHPKVAARYQYIKQVFAARYQSDIKTYSRAKRSFLDSVERLALNPHHPSPASAGTSPQRPASALVDRTISNTDQASSVPPGPCGGLPSDPTGWQVGTWYTCTPDHDYMVSPDQDPRNSNSVGWFVQWDGEIFSLVGRGLPGSDLINQDTGTPDAGTLDFGTLSQSDQYLYTAVIQRDDGTSYVELVVAPNATNPSIPDNAQVIVNTDGTLLVLYNTDGSPWTDGTTEGGSDGGDGGDGGFGYDYENPY